MGIGVLSAEEPPDDDIGEESTSSAEYHTDTDVYTSFYAINVGDVPFIGESSFSIYDSGGETPRKYEQLKEEAHSCHRKSIRCYVLLCIHFD